MFSFVCLLRIDDEGFRKRAFNHLDISLTEDQIKRMSTREYKKHIKEKVRSGAFRYLQSVQETHFKIRNIKYSKLEMQPYLCKENIGMLFSMRCRTFWTIRNVFQEQYKPNLSCPLCSSYIDSLPEILHSLKHKYTRTFRWNTSLYKPNNL